MSHSNICFKNLITLLVLLVLVYFHLPLRSNYYASQKKLYKWYWCSMAKYPELCQGICLPFMGQNCYRGIHKLMINSCLTPLSSLPPSPLFTHESVLSLVYLPFCHSQFTFYCLCEVTYHHSFNFIWPVLDSKEVKWSMNATWLKSPVFGFLLWCYYHAIYYFAWICNCFTCSTPGAGYILFDKALCRANLKKLGLLTKNELLVCIFSSEVEPKIPDDFGDAPLLGTT